MTYTDHETGWTVTQPQMIAEGGIIYSENHARQIADLRFTAHGEELARLFVLAVNSFAGLRAICEEIANDPRVDLVDSERRIRLYGAVTRAGGELS